MNDNEISSNALKLGFGIGERVRSVYNGIGTVIGAAPIIPNTINYVYVLWDDEEKNILKGENLNIHSKYSKRSIESRAIINSSGVIKLSNNEKIIDLIIKKGFSLGQIVDYRGEQVKIIGADSYGNLVVNHSMGFTSKDVHTNFCNMKAIFVSPEYIKPTITTLEDKSSNDKDLTIVAKLKRLGLKVGDKVFYPKDSFSPEKEMVVIGFSKSYPVVRYTDGSVRSARKSQQKEHIHSSHGSPKPGDFTILPSVLKSSNDLIIEKRLNGLNLSIGESVYFKKSSTYNDLYFTVNTILPSQDKNSLSSGKVVGFFDGSLIVELADHHLNGWNQPPEWLKESKDDIIHSSFIKDEKKQYMFFNREALLKSSELDMAKISDGLSSIGMALGQKYYFASDSEHPDKELIVVGYDGANPIVSYVDTSIVRKAYKAVDPKYVAPNHIVRPFAVWHTALSSIKPSEMVKEIPKNPEDTLARIKDQLAVVNLKIGDTRYFTSDKLYPEKQIIIVGFQDGLPVGIYSDGSSRNSVAIIGQYNIHSGYLGVGHPFRIHEDNLSKSDDFGIEKNLKKEGFLIGEEVAFTHSLNKPEDTSFTSRKYSDPDTNNGEITGTGRVVGFCPHTFSLIIELNFDHRYSWPADNGSPHIHSSHQKSSDNKKYFYFNPSAVIKKSQLSSRPQLKLKATQSSIPTTFAAKKKSYMIKADLKKAGYRIVARQALQLTHGAVLSIFKNKGTSGESLEALSTLLSTEYGKAAISMALGLAIPHIPGMDGEVLSNKQEHLAVLGQEFRIGGMTIAGNELVETIFQSALEAMLSSEESPRLASEEDSLFLEEAIDEELSEKKQRVA